MSVWGFRFVSRRGASKIFHLLHQPLIERAKAHMQGPGFGDLLLMILCYVYVLAMIQVASGLEGAHNLGKDASRKFLHVMIGNLPLVIPFFTWRFAPAIVAFPFIAVTLIASPHSPAPGLRERLEGLSGLTEEGHFLGPFLYSVSFTALAALFPTRPEVIAAGILPMAYGDSAAAIFGSRYGRHRLLGQKTLEGSLAMLVASFASLTLCMGFFSTIYGFPLLGEIRAIAAVSVMVVVAEALSPKDFDNLAVPLLGALTYIIAGGWI